MDTIDRCLACELHECDDHIDPAYEAAVIELELSDDTDDADWSRLSHLSHSFDLEDFCRGT